jgi:hypothetical protein
LAAAGRQRCRSDFLEYAQLLLVISYWLLATRKNTKVNSCIAARSVAATRLPCAQASKKMEIFDVTIGDWFSSVGYRLSAVYRL